jgi:hypothetical protein
MVAPIFQTEAEQVQDKTEQSLQRLTTALNSGVLQPSESQMDTEVSHAKQRMPTLMEDSDITNPRADKERQTSGCSSSTMAPEDTLGALTLSPKTNIRKAWSSNSISSMVSWADVADDEEVEFDLDINAGAEAAQKQAAAKKQAVIEAPLRPPGFFVDVTDAPPAQKSGKHTQEMTHSFVPKSHNMAEMAKATKNEPATTLMIRNIPGKYAQTDLIADLQDTGFGNAYDFLYLPIDKGTSNNVGYAFVNFVDPRVASAFMQAFAGHCFAQLHGSSNKRARISVAHLQGLEKNLAHYAQTAVSVSKQQQRRPVVLANMSQTF